MRALRRLVLLSLAAVVMTTTWPAGVAAQGTPIPNLGSPAFARVWARTDYPVVDGKAQRSLYFGPANLLSCRENYVEAPEGMRLVTYLDKARLELTDPAANQVTAGLLAKELISGSMQFGNSSFRRYGPANVPVAGDPVQSDAPTYASFAGVSSVEAGTNRAERRFGQVVTDTLNRAGQRGADASLGRYDVRYVDFREELSHNIPDKFADFFYQRGTIANVADDGSISFSEDTLIDWLAVMGLPISEAYWAQVPVGGATKWVLTQAYERRVITYTPDNEAAYRVEMGNIGQHYKLWRHPDGSCNVPAPPPDGGVQPPGDPVPDGKDATVDRKQGPWGTTFTISIRGFRANEQVSFWLTAPDGRTAGTPAPVNAGQHNGSLQLPISTNQAWAAGIWAVTFEGAASKHQSIAYFRVLARPAAPAPAEPVPDGRNATVEPKYGWQGTIFRVRMTGFRPNEKISFWLTAPDGQTVGTPAPLNIGQHSGNLQDIWRTSDAFAPGVWAVTYAGDASGHQAIVYFRIIG
jgi:hypothetical protein